MELQTLFQTIAARAAMGQTDIAALPYDLSAFQTITAAGQTRDVTELATLLQAAAVTAARIAAAIERHAATSAAGQVLP